MTKPTLETINSKPTNKTIIDTNHTQLFIDMIAELKRKTKLAEEPLLMLEKEATG